MRIKSGVLGIVPLAMTVAGCVSLDRMDGPLAGDRLVAFPTPLVSVATKASESGYPENCTFGVFGLYYPDGDFAGWEDTPNSVVYINGAEFKYSKDINDATEGSGAWVSTPAYYWPKTGRMTFAAWSPYSVKETYGDNFTYGDSGLDIKGFSTEANGDCDLMYSERTYDKSSSEGANANYDGIDIVFHHALSALRFGASSTSQGITVNVTKVVLWGFSRQGDFKENITGDNPYRSAPSWVNLENPYTEADPLVVSGQETFIIPQAVTDVKGAKMRVYYTVKVGNGNPVPAVSRELELLGHTLVDSDKEYDRWEMATRYNYNLLLTDQHQIKFSVNVMGWNDCDENDDPFTIED